jgi:hypothetical protein
VQPYQYALGNVLFGRGTDIPISKVDLQPYNVSNQDFQVIRTDETRFGIDTLVPAPIIFTMAVLENYPLDVFANDTSELDFLVDNLINRGSLLSSLATTWKAKETRATWGAAMPLYFCNNDEEVLRIYGRPGKFQYAPRVNSRSAWIDIQAEFRRADTNAYSDIELYIGDPEIFDKGLAPGADPVLAARGGGDADSWMRFLFTGPMSHPMVHYGDYVLEMNTSIPEGVSVEVSSYPWMRRVVDSNGFSRRAEVIGDTLYLDQIQFAAGNNMNVHWTCDDSNSSTGLYVLWRETYNVL